MPGIGIGIRGLGLGSTRGGGLSAYLSSMDYWFTGVEETTLSAEVGTDASLKEFSCVDLQATDLLQASAASFGPEGLTSTYQYDYTFVLDAMPASNGFCMVFEDGGLALRIYSTGLFRIYTGGFTDYVSGTVGSFATGLNEISLIINLTLRTIDITINGVTQNFNFVTEGAIWTSGYFRLSNGDFPMKPIYFLVKKDGVNISEFYFTRESSRLYQFEDLVGSDLFADLGNNFGTQSLYNPYKNGYNLYWNQGTLDKLRVSPINANGIAYNPDSLDLFHAVTSDKIGYHVINYIELPDELYFDTTNRTYWKVSIESDPYYVGATVGKERWFHRSWLNFEWINIHMEDAYKNLFFVRLRKKQAVNQAAIPVEINDIVYLQTEINYFNSNKDILNSENYGNLFFSKMIDFDTFSRIYDRHNDKLVSQRSGYLQFSDDAGKTWNTGIEVSTINDFSTLTKFPVTLVRILSNGNIVVFTPRKAYYSTDNLTTLIECTYLNDDDTAYVFHTPANATYPGGYFKDFHNFIEDNGVLIFGNYANSGYGASPINYYYSLDNGLTWKVFYTFGQNPNFTDDGTVNGGTGGTLLGDAGNSVLTRHIHGINIGGDGKYYAATGDGDGEMHFIKLVYDSVGDAWTVTDLLAGTDAVDWHRNRAIGIIEKDGYIYWGSDGTVDTVVDTVTYDSHGIYRALIANLGDIAKHELLQALTDESFYFAPLQNNIWICGLDSENEKVYISTDKGDTWTDYSIPLTSAMRSAHFDHTNNYVITINRYIMEYLD